MTYTERFSEVWELLDTVYGLAVPAASEANTGFLHVADYIRIVVIIHPMDINDALDIDLEQATTFAAGDAKALNANGKDTTIATADTKPTVIEIRPDEFDVTGGFDWLNVEITPANTGGDCNDYVVEVWGEPVYKPADTTNLDSVVD